MFEIVRLNGDSFSWASLAVARSARTYRRPRKLREQDDTPFKQ